MLAKHTPQSLMVMKWHKKTGQWINQYVENSKTLNHYENYDIMEAARFPSWVHQERYTELVNNNAQIAELVKNGYDFLEVITGNYKSILFSMRQKPLHQMS